MRERRLEVVISQNDNIKKISQLKLKYININEEEIIFDDRHKDQNKHITKLIENIINLETNELSDNDRLLIFFVVDHGRLPKDDNELRYV